MTTLPTDTVGPGGTIRDGATVVGEVRGPDDAVRHDIIVDDVQFSLVEVSATGEARTTTIPGPFQYAVDKPLPPS